TLPATAKITAQRLEFSSFPILGYSLTSNNVPQAQLWELANYTLKPRLASLPGVGTIVVQGMDVPEFQIAPDPEKSLVTGVTVSDILNGVANSNLIESPGLFARNHQLYLGLVSGQAHTPADIANIFIKRDASGNPIYVRDVAKVSSSVAPNYTVVTADSRPAVLLNVNRQPSSNTLQVAQEVKSELQQIEATLPPGVKVRNFYDQSWIVGESIK